MAESEKTDKSAHQAQERRDRYFSVSSIRGKVGHKLRYVETDGAAVGTEDWVFVSRFQSFPVSRKKRRAVNT